MCETGQPMRRRGFSFSQASDPPLRAHPFLTLLPTIFVAKSAIYQGDIYCVMKTATSRLSLRSAVTYRVVAHKTDGTYVDQAAHHTAFGNWVDFVTTLGLGTSDFTAAHVMTNRKSKDIKLTFPAAGYRGVQNGKLFQFD